MRTYLVVLCMFLGTAHASERILCSYIVEEGKVDLRAFKIEAAEWEQGIKVIEHREFIKVASFETQRASIEVLDSTYIKEEGSHGNFQTYQNDILSLYRGGFPQHDADIQIPGLVSEQQIPGRLTNNKYVSEVPCWYLCSKIVIQEKIEKELKEYCPKASSREG